DVANVDPHAAALLPAEVARELLALPVGFGPEHDIVVAIADPHDAGLRDRLVRELGMPVRLALTPRRALVEAIAAQRGHAPASGPSPDAVPPSQDATAVDLDELLVALVERGGSDLHLTVGIPPTIRVNGDLT